MQRLMKLLSKLSYMLSTNTRKIILPHRITGCLFLFNHLP